MFRSKKHNVRTLEVNKLALSGEDDKRISIDGIDSLAMGHKNLLSHTNKNCESNGFTIQDLQDSLSFLLLSSKQGKWEVPQPNSNGILSFLP